MIIPVKLISRKHTLCLKFIAVRSISNCTRNFSIHLSTMNCLHHETVFEDSTVIAKHLPLCDSILHYYPNGTFPLTEDPLVKKKSTIIGMFVVRPADSLPYSDTILDETGFPSSLYKHYNWSYNCVDIEGGWLISGRNSLDGLRLALQYGCVDAVIIGSNTVSIEGVDTATSKGYIWQAFGPCGWDNIKALDPNLLDKINEQRQLWQQLDYLSSRSYPAQIVFSWSGEHFAGSNDFLQSRIFWELLPNGEPYEVYIITSEMGAKRIRERAGLYNLQDRIDNMLIVIPPRSAAITTTYPTSAAIELSTDIDISLIPQILFERYNMRIVNHDGGHRVLHEFCKQGAISQLNLTLGRHQTVKEVVATIPGVDSTLRATVLASFEPRMRYFFSYPRVDNASIPTNSEATVAALTATNSSSSSNTEMSLSHGIPPTLPVAHILTDSVDNSIVVATFDTRGGFDFFRKQ